jgi:hypothetical protein
MKKLTPWVGGAVVITIIFGALYATTQHIQRSDADYPQVQLAQDAAAALNQGAQKLSVTQGKVEMTSSLGSFVNVYDQEGAVVAGSGLVDGQVPTPPIGMLKASAHKDYNRVTWAPKSGVRIAAVVVASEKYFVLSGRSLRVVEQDEATTLNIVAAGEVASILVIATCYFIVTKKIRTRAAKSEPSDK